MSLAFPPAVDCLAGAPIFRPTINIAGDLTQHEWEWLLVYYDRMQEDIPSGAVLFFGDSITQGRAVVKASPFAVNLGIGGESMRYLMYRLDGRPGAVPQAIHRAGACVLQIGVNDLGNSAHYTSAIAAADTVGFMYSQLALSITGKWVIVVPTPVYEPAVPPITNAAIAKIGTYITQYFGTNPNVRIVNVNSQLIDGSGQLATWARGSGGSDPEHLSAAGYAVLHAAIAAALVDLGVQQA